MVWLSMLDLHLMLWAKLPVVDRIHPQSNNLKFVAGVENKATGDSKPNDSPAEPHVYEN